MPEETLRRELRASFKNRAILYYLIFDELRNELGPDRACRSGPIHVVATRTRLP